MLGAIRTAFVRVQSNLPDPSYFWCLSTAKQNVPDYLAERKSYHEQTRGRPSAALAVDDCFLLHPAPLRPSHIKRLCAVALAIFRA